ncbi:MAG: carboxypeptidase regulatory-like domain-containing protein [Armatimonadota bacterium]
MQACCLITALITGLTSTPASSETPRPGFVLVIGRAVPGFSHSDHGAPVQVQALALKHSHALLGYCNVPRNEAIDILLNSGREIVAYVHAEEAELEYYYRKGVRLFIVGNEPDGDPESYGKILERISIYSQTATPDAKLIGGNCFTTPPYETLYQKTHFRESCHMVGFHCYSDEPDTGINVSAVGGLHSIMKKYGDESKLIFLGEGWGPKRELRIVPRVSPYIPPSVSEIEAMRQFLVNGWQNICTQQAGYDPAWVYGVLFFTLSDNWGFDYSHFYNGGLIDFWGNPKDDLLLLFPGNQLTISNSGFEYSYPSEPRGAAPWWKIKPDTPIECYGVDASIRKAGLRSQRLTLVNGLNEVYITQETVKGSVEGGQTYTFGAWVKTENLVQGDYQGARVRIRFRDAQGTILGPGAWSRSITGTTDWTYLTVTATTPPNASSMLVECNLRGVEGKAWFDDCSVSLGPTITKGAIEGYVLKPDNTPIPDAHITTPNAAASARSDATGRFVLSELDPGVYDVIATASGFSKKTVTKIVVAPGRTSIAGLHLQPITDGAPTNVEVTSCGISGVIKLTWDAPAGGADYYRIYRSTKADVLGECIADKVTKTTFYDENLADFQTYYYTVRTVKGGIESENVDAYPGVPTGGATLPIYDTNADPDWANNAPIHGQTFVAPKRGNIVSATCVLANSEPPNYRKVTFSIHEGGPNGKQIGPAKTVTCYFNEIGTAQWSAGEVLVEEGKTYYLRLILDKPAAIYRSRADVIPGGRYFMNDQPYPSEADLWSTISLAENRPLDIFNVVAEETASGEIQITWETNAPATSQVLYGTDSTYGFSSAVSETPTARHKILLGNLAAGKYHFCVKSTRRGLPDAVSLDYTFTITK